MLITLRGALRRLPLARASVLQLRILKSRLLPHSLLFQQVYQANGWGSSESVSGSGSTLDATAQIRATLPPLWQRLGIRTLVDAPCGDFHWMRHIVHHLDNYVGIDVVSDLIEKNQPYSSAAIHFRRGDLTKELLPKADAILVRDCLVHFSYRDIDRALENIRRSGIRYLIATTFPGVENRDYHSGGWWRPLDLEGLPFALGKARERMPDSCSDDNEARAVKALGVWDLYQRV